MSTERMPREARPRIFAATVAPVLPAALGLLDLSAGAHRGSQAGPRSTHSRRGKTVPEAAVARMLRRVLLLGAAGLGLAACSGESPTGNGDPYPYDIVFERREG